jgi:23S rRNA (adenine2030-N6)-methyltransferase
MQYRHSFHAGSFADVHKHVALLALLAALQRKDGGFLYLETHAGRGAYDLARPRTEAMRAAQSALRALQPPLQRRSCAIICSSCSSCGRTSTMPTPIPARRSSQRRSCARRTVRCCFEIVPSEARALARALRGYGRARVEEADGFERLRAYLPPRERRSLV